MELALSLGETPKPFQFLGKTSSQNMVNKDLGFCMGIGTLIRGTSDQIRLGEEKTRSSSDQPLQLDLLPFSPVPRSQPSSRLQLPWLKDNLLPEPGNSSNGQGRGLGLSRPSEERENGAFLSSFQNQMDSSVDKKRKRDLETMSISTEYDRDQKGGGSSSRGSDEEEEDNGLTRKKLRLSKEQSAFLEESFKEHNTLNPKQKVDLAKQLKLRPRQVEVWFQNRRARTKLKQTEVDCEYLKRCYETLTQENRKLQKEVQELKVLKTSQPFYNHLPPTTLTICLSCERPPSTVAAATTTRH